LEAAGIACQRLEVSHAFHSEAIDPMIQPFKDAISELKFSSPRVPLASNLTGTLSAAAPSAGYWAAQVRSAVQYARGISALQESGFRMFLEIGPEPMLTRFGRKSSPSHCTWLSTLAPPECDVRSVLDSAAVLFERGIPIDWSVLIGDAPSSDGDPS
jgi:acyl transferase domain-containing protein